MYSFGCKKGGDLGNHFEIVAGFGRVGAQANERPAERSSGQVGERASREEASWRAGKQV